MLPDTLERSGEFGLTKLQVTLQELQDMLELENRSQEHLKDHVFVFSEALRLYTLRLSTMLTAILWLQLHL